MIALNSFLDILREFEFDEQAIKRIRKKNINTILKKGKPSQIRDIFKVLKEKDISNQAIEKCLSIFVFGNANEIKKIFKVLED